MTDYPYAWIVQIKFSRNSAAMCDSLMRKLV